MLLLKRHLVELVRRGLKRQTIRLWSKPLLRVGQISFTPGLGKMKITAIDKLPNLEALTEQDAVADGFTSLAALLAEIRRIYGPTPPANRHVYRIRFSWPIDSAGKTLVLPPAPTASKTLTRKPAPQKKHVAPQISRRKAASGADFLVGRSSRPSSHADEGVGTTLGKSHMSPAQRETLRSYIIAQKTTTLARRRPELLPRVK